MSTNTESVAATTPEQPPTAENLAFPAVLLINPVELLTDRNARSEADLDKKFLASIQDHGVLQPITAVRTIDGKLRVRLGHRRTLAAVHLGLATVPVIVAGDESGESPENAAEIERLLTQYDENERRAGLPISDQIGVAHQLHLLGLSPAQVAKRTRMARAEVTSALQVADSELATKATSRYDLTIDQAAVVAEFDNDPEAVKRLVLAAREGGFDHLTQQLRDTRAEDAARTGVTQALTDAGITVTDRPGYDASTRPLQALLNAEGEDITPEAHASCPGHAAYVDWEWDDENDAVGSGEDGDEVLGAGRSYARESQFTRTANNRSWGPEYVCLDPEGNGHQNRYARHSPAGPGDASRPTDGQEPTADEIEQEREARREQRRDVIASNKAWQSAETVRRNWLRAFATRKAAPKDAITYVTQALATGDHALTQALTHGHYLALHLLGLTESDAIVARRNEALLEYVNAANPARQQMITLTMILSAYEGATNRDSWRYQDSGTTTYLTYLERQGYELSPVERRARGEAITILTTTEDDEEPKPSA